MMAGKFGIDSISDWMIPAAIVPIVSMTKFGHLPVFETDSSLWTEALLFRDILRQSKQTREEYNSLKKRLAKKFADNREEYTKGKARFISEIINRAQTML